MSRSSPRVKNIVTRFVCKDLDTRGLNPLPLLKRAGLSRSAVEAEEGWISYGAHAAFVESAAGEIGDCYYGLNLARRVGIKEFGALAYVGLSSRTFQDALLNHERYMAVLNEAWQIQVYTSGQEVILNFDPVVPEFANYPQATEASLALTLNAYRYFVGQSLSAIEIGFLHPLARHREKAPFEEAFKCPVKFRRNQLYMTFSSEWLKAPIKTADDKLLKVLKTHCLNVLKAEGAPRHEVVASVRFALAERLSSGHVIARVIAQELGMTERTLHRRLTEEGTSFGEVSDNLRRSLADTYLQEKQLSIKKIAFLLGYSDASAFGAAYRRWTGNTPKKARTTSSSL